MNALIHFIGIVTFVSTTTVTPGPPHMLLPRFPSIIPKANNVIQIPSNLVDPSTTWPSTTVGNNKTFDIDVRNIRISGNRAFNVDPNTKTPHLTCCCADMTEGFLADYEDANVDPQVKKAAYVTLDHGSLFSFEDKTTGEVHLDLVVTDDVNELVITGSEKNKPDLRIVVKLPRNVPVGEIVFFNRPDNGAHSGHWRSYYLMGKNPKAKDCPAVPSKNPDCRPKLSGCLATGALAKAATPKAIKALGAPPKSKLHFQSMAFTDVDCSNSQFP